MKDYNSFLCSKIKLDVPTGMTNPPKLSSMLFDFQKSVTDWACRRGKAAIFEGTGLGKSFQELSWAKAVYEEEKKPVIIFCPLAVSGQMVREANKFGLEASKVEGNTNDPIQVTNYQKIDNFDLSKYCGVVLDESSILKNQIGHYRTQIIDVCSKIPYRLAATATPSPNDYMELGNHSEFCGIMSYTDMLSTFFCHDGSSTQNWRLKGHAEDKFWEWMSNWSIMFSSPEDIGFDGSKYILPKLHQIQHTVGVKYEPNIDTGLLFPFEAQSLSERLSARRATIKDRVNEAASIVDEKRSDPWVIWCNLNDESAMLVEKIKGSVELTGSMSDEKKEQILEDFDKGNISKLITKPSIAGFGMNWQFCNNTAFVGLNDSFEQVYQAIRRFWRFGQENEVNAHFIASEIEGAVVANIKRKEQQAEHMMSQMVKHMSGFTSKNIRMAKRDTMDYLPNEEMKLPTWMV